MSETVTETVNDDAVVVGTDAGKPQTPAATTEKQPVIRDAADAIKELRKENAKLRKTLDEQATARAEQLSDAKLEALRAETEQKANENAKRLVEDRLKEIDETNKARLAKAELKGAAMKAGVIDFDDVYEILKRADLKKIEFGEDGDVTNAADIIAGLKQSKPHLFGGVNTSSVERAPQSRAPVVNDKPALTMSREEYANAKRALGRM